MNIIIQHIDTLSKYGHKTHDVCQSTDIYNFVFLREVKMTTACNFISLGEKCVNY